MVKIDADAVSADRASERVKGCFLPLRHYFVMSGSAQGGLRQ